MRKGDQAQAEIPSQEGNYLKSLIVHQIICVIILKLVIHFYNVFPIFLLECSRTLQCVFSIIINVEDVSIIFACTLIIFDIKNVFTYGNGSLTSIYMFTGKELKSRRNFIVKSCLFNLIFCIFNLIRCFLCLFNVTVCFSCQSVM